MVKGKKEKDDGGPSAEDQALLVESKRLQELAVSRGLLSRSRANPAAPLLPTKTILRCDGKDIVKKGNRKTKYLFAFPGLVAPIAGGKFGELTHLDSRNPTFYIDFPKGRLKLFGTIVYPKNKYLTMHFLPGRGDIVCEDFFESIVVFPEAWWIGTKEENPEEFRLAMPTDLQQEKHANFDFRGGAGGDPNLNATAEVPRSTAAHKEPESPEEQFPVDRFVGSQSSVDVEGAAVRRSARKTVPTTYYGLSSSNDSEGDSDVDSQSSDFKRKAKRPREVDDDAVQHTRGGTVKEEDLENKGPPVQTAVKKEIGKLFGSVTTEEIAGISAPKGVFKQSTLTSFLNKEETVDAEVFY